jgi:hypothetical protein
MFGAIGTGLTIPFFMLAESTNAQDFERFLTMLVEHIRPDITQKPVLVIDGHPAHFTRSNLSLM